MQALKQKVDDEVKRIVDEQYQRGMTLLRVPWRRMGLPGSRMGLPGSRMGLPGSRMGLPGSRMGLPGSRMGLPGSRMGLIVMIFHQIFVSFILPPTSGWKWEMDCLQHDRFLSFRLIFHSMMMGDKVSPKNQGKMTNECFT